MLQKPDSVIRHLTQRQLADRWQMSPRTLERWRWLGQGPRFLKLGGRVIYRLEDVEVYEAQQLRDSTTASPSIQPAAWNPGSMPAFGGMQGPPGEYLDRKLQGSAGAGFPYSTRPGA